MSPKSETPDDPLFANLRDDDPTVVAAVNEARETIPQFKAAYSAMRFRPASYFVKIPFVDRSDIGAQALVRTTDSAVENSKRPIAHLWLSVTSVLEELIFCSVYEAPEQLLLSKGISFVVDEEIVEDWLINHEGVVYGGYSLAIIRNGLSEKNRQHFDDHTGIREFRRLMP